MYRRPLWQLTIALLALSLISSGQSSWEEKNLAGEKAFQQGHLLDANRLFNEALREAQQFGPNDVRLAPIYNNLGLLAFVQNNFIDSEALFEKSIGVMQAQGLQNPLLLPALDNLSSLYLKQWAFGKAIQTSWRACHIREKKFGTGSLETADGLNKLATLYLDNVRLLPQSSSDRPSSLDSAGPNPTLISSDCILPKFGLSIENAPVLDDDTKLVIAESLFEKVLEIREKAYGDESTRLVDLLENLGEVYRSQQENASAEKVYTRAISIIGKSFGPDDLKLALPFQHLAELKTEEGNNEEAAKLYQRALQIDDSKAAASPSSLAALLTGYAALLEKMNKPQEARTLSGRAQSLSELGASSNIKVDPDASAPYILRFEKFVYDKYTGFQQTCALISADGRFRVEEQQQERSGPGIVQGLPHPDNEGIAPQETMVDHSSDSHPSKVFESMLDSNALQQLQAILSNKDVRDLNGRYSPANDVNSAHIEKISATILRDDGVQNFIFPDDRAFQPHENALKPLVKWLNTAEKHKGNSIKGAILNDCSPGAPKPTASQSLAARAAPPHDSIPTLKVDVRLVPVHVVVKDTQGRTVGNLSKADFQIFDQDKPQVITGFSVEHTAISGELATTQPDNSNPQHRATARYIAYLFDDLHLVRTDLVRAREAAGHQLASFSPTEERVAIFTTSGQKGIDFTGDRDKLHETLDHIEPRKKQKASECPSLTHQLSDAIANHDDQDALHTAAEDALECAFDTKNLDSRENIKYKKTAIQMAQSAAREMIETERIENESLLRILKELVAGMSTAPGLRSIVVISPGFFLSEDQSQAEIIDQAVRANVIVSALDPRGLVPAGDIGDQSISKFDPNNPGKTTYVDPGDSEQQGVLRDLADATGGIFFHNSNNIAEGFHQVAAAPEYSYVLAFAPHDVPSDGRFHKLKVTVNGNEKLIIQARKGYYAPRKQN